MLLIRRIFGDVSFCVASLTVFLSGSIALAGVPQTDPLFALMQGTWEGHGLRIQTVSSHRVRLDVETEAHLDANAKLQSRNRFVETRVDDKGNNVGPAKSYERSYWLRSTVCPAGPITPAGMFCYELGYGEGDLEIITSQGRFDGRMLEVTQEISRQDGAALPLIVRSRTDFSTAVSEGVTDYVDTVWHGQRKLTESHIFYRRR
jgi:hypothetical protein